MGRMERTRLGGTGRSNKTSRESSRTEAVIHDSVRIDMDDWSSRQYWSDRLGLTQVQLMRTVKAVGASVTRIEDYLYDRRQRRLKRRRAATVTRP